MKTTLRDRTQHLLTHRPAVLKIRMIAEQTGIPENWLFEFARGAMNDPGVCRVQTLYEYLTKSELIPAVAETNAA